MGRGKKRGQAPIGAIASETGPAPLSEILFYHVAPQSARESITRDGLDAATHGFRWHSGVHWHDPWHKTKVTRNNLLRMQEDAVEFADNRASLQDVWAVDVSTYIDELRDNDDYGHRVAYYVERSIARESLRGVVWSTDEALASEPVMTITPPGTKEWRATDVVRPEFSGGFRSTTTSPNGLGFGIPEEEQVDAGGKKEWRLSKHEGLLHRIDGPAVIWPDGETEYWVMGQLSRLDGPAIEYVNGSKEWRVEGCLHREDGPAIERANGSKEFYLDGEVLSEQAYWDRIADLHAEREIERLAKVPVSSGPRSRISSLAG